MRRANTLLLLIALLHAACVPRHRELSPWAQASRGTLHIQSDFTASLDSAWCPPSPSGEQPQRSRVVINGVSREGIYMQAPARARFPVFVHPGARLVTWFAMMPQAWAGSTDGAEFRVSVIGTELDSVLLGSTRLNPRVLPNERGWFSLEHYLEPWVGSRIMIELAVEPGPLGDTFQDWCMWGEPVVVSPPLDPPEMHPRLTQDALRNGQLDLDMDFVATRDLGSAGNGHSTATFAVSAFELRGIRCEGLYAHPPWLLSQVVIPGTRARMVMSLGMAETCWDQSNGVMFTVSASLQEGERRVLFEYFLSPRMNQCDRRWINVAVDLTEWAGQPLRLNLGTSAGPDGDLVCDSVMWGAPVIVSYR